MATEEQKIATSHFHPLRIHKKKGVLELTGEQIAVLAFITLQITGRRVLNEQKNNG